MFCKENKQHLGERREHLSNLTWYESLLLARVHPVISVVTLTATGLLCYSGHVCNYYVKVFEWFRGLPAVLRDKKWFMIKRRRSIHATTVDRRQKKPTTANRQRLEAGIAAAMKYMPKVYRDSVISQEQLTQFPLDEEQEMLEQVESKDLAGEVHMDRTMFEAWAGAGKAHPQQFPCAAVLMQHAADQQHEDFRGAVAGDTAWDLSCRILSKSTDDKAMGTRDLASLIIYLLDGQVPAEMNDVVYQGMREELKGDQVIIQTY